MAAANHINLELDLVTGKRGDRQDHVRDLLTQLTGAEDAFVVQNCAAAVFLVLHAIALRKEVMLSRGQMVEIGGSFRLPDIVKQSGCKLVEIGATNKTRLEDFTRALSPRSKVVLRCHPSNYQVIGFTEEPSAVDLSGFCKANNLILVDDLGSGCLVDTTQYGLPKTPTFMDSVKAGADVVMASGDKLLGGPQSGIIVGDSEVLRRIRKHPLARAVRIDKLSLTALETTLRLYTTGRELEIPTLRYMARKVEEIRTDAEQLQQAYVGGSVIEDGITEIGGGSLPGTGLPTVRVGLLSPRPEKLASALRHGKPPILTRIEKDTVWLDPRTLDTEEVAIAAGLLREAH
jgi:L-seryl-tRNA(Ser) seleniumtransferase